MKDEWERTYYLLGEDAIERLAAASVAVVGLGGVGGYVVEALARAGVGELTLVDNDRISVSNINRQLLAVQDTVGWYKTAAAKERVLAINPDCVVHEVTCFFDEDVELDWESLDYVVDAIDTVESKVILAKACRDNGVPEIACMGTGNKVDPMAFEIVDLYQTRVCPLCRAMRKRCKAEGIDKLTVLYSREIPLHTELGRVPASCSWTPAAAGVMIASYVARTLTDVWGNGIDKS